MTVTTRPTRFWHGFADRHLVADREVIMERGRDAVAAAGAVA